MTYDDVVGHASQAIDAAGVAAIGLGAIIALVVAAVRIRRGEPQVYNQFRQMLGRSILLGLELLVAGDIIRTVAEQATLTSVAILAAIVVIRTFLSWTLELEITGRWPWQQQAPGPLQPGAGSAQPRRSQ